MSEKPTITAVEHSVHVALAPAAVFDLFTRQIARWWPFVGHSCYGTEALNIEFEPRTGGAVTEVARNGDRMAWGCLSAWQPPDGFAMSWHPGMGAEQATLLAVRFVAVGSGTDVSIHHSGWEARGDQAATRRDQYNGGWPITLAAFAACAGQEGLA